MAELMVACVTMAVTAAVFVLWRRERLARLARERLDEAVDATGQELPALRRAGVFPARYRWVPWAMGAAFGIAVYLVFDWQLVYPVALGVVVALVGSQVEQILAERRVQTIEIQLADTIDLMVGALRAGVSLTAALDNALSETQRPLTPYLGEVVGRIRLGDDPRAVFRSLANQVPIETFLLFSSALSVHWEVGGSLAPTLATVGRTIRDRIELSRRVRAMSAQSRVSTVAVLCTTYFIGLVMWRSDPGRMEEFVSTEIGGLMVAGVVLLQAVGIVWIAAMSKVKF